MTYIRRDPFARVELHRARAADVDLGGRACPWCGRPARWAYRTEHDAGRVSAWAGPFCSVGCYRSYLGL